MRLKLSSGYTEPSTIQDEFSLQWQGDGIHTGRVIHTQFTGDSRELHVLPANEDILRVVHCVSLNGIIHATLVIAIA